MIMNNSLKFKHRLITVNIDHLISAYFIFRLIHTINRRRFNEQYQLDLIG